MNTKMSTYENTNHENGGIFKVYKLCPNVFQILMFEPNRWECCLVELYMRPRHVQSDESRVENITVRIHLSFI